MRPCFLEIEDRIAAGLIPVDSATPRAVLIPVCRSSAWLVKSPPMLLPLKTIVHFAPFSGAAVKCVGGFKVERS